MKTYERFLNYAAYPTMSDEESETCPSTKKQLKLGKALVEELISLGLTDAEIDENHMKRVEAIILSMTRQERLRPEVINGSRRKRIANGSGTTVEDVNKLLRQFEQMKKTMKQFTNMGKRRSFAGLKLPF